MARSVMDRHAKQAVKTLKETTTLGLCFPGHNWVNNDGSLAIQSPTGAEGDELIAEQLDTHLGLDCGVKCPDGVEQDGSDAQRCEFSCKEGEKSGFEYTSAKKSPAARRDTPGSARKVRTVSPVTKNARVLMHSSCAGSIAMFPNDASAGFQISATGMMEVLHWFRGEHREAFNCRATAHGGSALSDAQYNVRSMTLDNVLYHVTSPVSTMLSNLGVGFNDMAIGDVDERMAMPSSCTFDSWIQDGQCRLTFDGLSDPLFFDAQTDLNMYLTVCPGSFVPEAYVECVGIGCELFGAPIPCKLDADCPYSALKCETIRQAVEDEEEPATPPPSQPIAPPQCDRKRRVNAGSVIAERASAMVESYSELTRNMHATLNSVFAPFIAARDTMHARSKTHALSKRGLAKRQTTSPGTPPPTSGVPSTPGAPSTYPATPGAPNTYTTPGYQTTAETIPYPTYATVVSPPEVEDSSSVAFAAGFIGMFDAECESNDATERGFQAAERLIGALATRDATNKPNVCIPTNIAPSNLEKWGEKQVETQGDTIRLTSLKAWSPNHAIRPIDGGTTIKNQPWREDTGIYAKDRYGSDGVFEGNYESSASVAVLSALLAVVALFVAF